MRPHQITGGGAVLNVSGEQSRPLYITHVITKVCYLVDTDSEVSVLLASSNDSLRGSVLNLQTANEKPITTYGNGYAYLNVGLRRPIH